METVLQQKSALVDIPLDSFQCRRSVLDKEQKGMVGRPMTSHVDRPMTSHVGRPKTCDMTWSRGNNHVSKFDGKARMRHLEAVRARIVRAREICGDDYLVRGKK